MIRISHHASLTSQELFSEIMDSGDKKNDISLVATIDAKQKKTENASAPAKAEITLKEFLDFLKAAYQIHENIEKTLAAEGMNEMVDWIKLRDTEVVKNTIIFDSSSKKGEEKFREDLKKKIAANMEPINEKLNEFLNEGVADSILPNLIPATTGTSGCKQRSSGVKLNEKLISSNTSVSSSSGLHINRRKSNSSTANKVIKTDSEVEIHVCDEIKGLKKDFICNQKLLVEQMGYFADVTKEQKLDDMEISVHCDITIFEWLMKWVKRDLLEEHDKPILEVSSAIPILVSASFLQMEPLIEECLFFCHRNMNEILKSSSLSCLNDAILTRLAAMYTNVEVETLRDRKDKIQSRLFCKLIQSLCEVEPESLRGHFCSLAKVYRCKHCQQLINPDYGAKIPCVPTCMSLQTDGSIKNKHIRDPNWDLNEYIVCLHKSLKTWRKVYWKLWGSAHFLCCIVCKRYFCAKQDGWCRFHPDHPQFFTLDAQKPPLPVGRYPCCGERAYRFQLLEDRSGCYFRDHTTSTKDVKETAISGMLETYRSLIVDEPPQLVFPDRLTRLVAREPTSSEDGKLESKEVFWWEGLELVPPRPKLGLLGYLSEKRVSDNEESLLEEGNDSDYEDDLTQSSSTSTNSPGSEESISVSEKKKVRGKVGKKAKQSKLWQPNLSSRSNQDIQRSKEEAAFKEMSNILNNRTMILTDDVNNKGIKYVKHSVPQGGLWVRLESDWKEKNAPNSAKNKNIYSGRLRMKTTKFM